MFLKSLVAAAIVIGSASIASAQLSDSNMMDYQRVGPQLASAGANYDGAFDEDNMRNYGPIGYSARAQVPSPEKTQPELGRSPHAFDEDSVKFYGPLPRR